jgi:hypothetical protein
MRGLRATGLGVLCKVQHAPGAYAGKHYGKSKRNKAGTDSLLKVFPLHTLVSSEIQQLENILRRYSGSSPIPGRCTGTELDDPVTRLRSVRLLNFHDCRHK